MAVRRGGEAKRRRGEEVLRRRGGAWSEAGVLERLQESAGVVQAVQLQNRRSAVGLLLSWWWWRRWRRRRRRHDKAGSLVHATGPGCRSLDSGHSKGHWAGEPGLESQDLISMAWQCTSLISLRGRLGIFYCICSARPLSLCTARRLIS
nr:hypothetical protein CFP56_32135 [Quercus suber]